VERLNFEIFRLSEEVELFKKMSNVEYVRSLERKVKDLKETVSAQEDDYKVLAKKNEESSLEIEQLRKEVSELQVSCAEMEEKVYDLSVVKERTEIYLLRTKDRFD
jgi:chromosome segregation ATPase